MRIDGVRAERSGGRARITTTITWEDNVRAPFAAHFEVEDSLAAALAHGADAFLIGCAIPALHHGERRIQVVDQISPELIDGVTTVMTIMQHWFEPAHALPVLDVRAGATAAPSRAGGRAGCFFSGGVDSLAALRANRLQFAPTHEGSIADGLLVYGLEIDEPQSFLWARAAVQRLADDAALTLVPVYTNLRHLDDDWDFYRREFQGAVLAAICHALAGRLTSVVVGGTADITNLVPLASHPLVEPTLSTHQCRLRYDGLTRTRLDKVRLLLDWPAALAAMRVCNDTRGYADGRLNCGVCEKCVRTRLELLALGRLESASAFPVLPLSEEQVANSYIDDEYTASCYGELLDLLDAQGRADLRRGVTRALDRHRGETGLRGRLKRADRIYLNGTLRTFRHAVARVI